MLLRLANVFPSLQLFRVLSHDHFDAPDWNFTGQNQKPKDWHYCRGKRKRINVFFFPQLKIKHILLFFKIVIPLYSSTPEYVLLKNVGEHREEQEANSADVKHCVSQTALVFGSLTFPLLVLTHIERHKSKQLFKIHPRNANCTAAEFWWQIFLWEDRHIRWMLKVWFVPDLLQSFTG